MTDKQQDVIIDPKLLTDNIDTTCPYCGVGCGVTVSNSSNQSTQTVLVNGDKYHPANFGKLCIKGKSLSDTLDNNNRLRAPKINNKVQKWSRSLDFVASKINQSIEEFGKESVGFYVSGQLLTEDYYVANKLMKGFIGTGNIDTNSRLCMSSAVSAHKRAFGEDIVPMSYSDITKADLIVLAGSNLAWCHPVIYQRIREEKARRPDLKLIVIDPRVTASIELADLHLPIKAGQDVTLFNGLLNYLHEYGFIDQGLLDSIDDSSSQESGLTQALANAKEDSLQLSSTGLSKQDLDTFYQLFANNEKVVTIFSQGINQSKQGTDQVNGIINCHLVTNKIGKIGCGAFSVTGQPNAMGGREVGGLANTLASHIEFKDTHLHEALANFWQTDNLATKEGLKAVDLFDAVESGKIKVLWIMATNPIVSMPNQEKIKQALKKCPLVIVSDCVASSDTLEYADVIFPAHTWGEKSGTVTNSERRISRQRSFLKPFGEAKADWWIISEVAKRMGFPEQFSYDSAYQIFAEHARLSGLKNEGSRAFDISAFGELNAEQYQRLQPFQWPQPYGKSIKLSDQNFFSDGYYYHDNNKAKIIPIKSNIIMEEPHLFTLNTGRNRDQWHTQTRTGKSTILSQRHPEPEVEINQQDADLLNISDGQLVRIETDNSRVNEPFIIRAKTSKLQRLKEIFIPIHWSESNFNQGCVSKFIKAEVDAVSGQPAFKHSKVSIKPWETSSEAMLVVKDPINENLAAYQVEQKIEGGYCYYLANIESPKDFFERLNTFVFSSSLQGVDHNESSVLNATNLAKNYFRKSYFVQDKIQAAILVSQHRSDLPQGWISKIFKEKEKFDVKRNLISDDSKRLQSKNTFCQCLQVEVNDIDQAIASGGITIDSIRSKTKAGNGCGSCIGDIALKLQQYAV
jgi:assimilatory nitrate reductase catalytic subunit